MDNKTGSLNGNEISHARLALHGRILRCVLSDNPADCPLYDIRQLPIEERITWLESKTDDEVEKLFEFHTKCLGRKIVADQERPR